MPSLLVIIFILITKTCEAGRDRGARCEKPDYIPNGSYRMRRERLLRITCDSGFVLQGPKTIDCIRGKWEGEKPVCAKKGCKKDFEQPENGRIQIEKDVKAILYCSDSYNLAGNRHSYCNGSQWDRPIGNCREHKNVVQHECDFETDDICGWTYEPQEGLEWRRIMAANVFTTFKTGPRHDHTTLTANGGHYMLMESLTKQNDYVTLTSPIYERALSLKTACCFQFYYFMYGAGVGDLFVVVKPVSLDLEDVLKNRKDLIKFQKYGNQNNIWNEAHFNIEEMEEDFQILFVANSGRGQLSDIAIDDVKLMMGNECNALDTKDEEKLSNEEYDATTYQSIFEMQSCEGRCLQSPGSGLIRTFGHLKGLCNCDIDCEDNETCCPDFRAVCSNAIFAQSTIIPGANDGPQKDEIPKNDATTSTQATTPTRKTTPKVTTTTKSTSTTATTFPTPMKTTPTTTVRTAPKTTRTTKTSTIRVTTPTTTTTTTPKTTLPTTTTRKTTPTATTTTTPRTTPTTTNTTTPKTTLATTTTRKTTPTITTTTTSKATPTKTTTTTPKTTSTRTTPKTTPTTTTTTKTTTPKTTTAKTPKTTPTTTTARKTTPTSTPRTTVRKTTPTPTTTRQTTPLLTTRKTTVTTTKTLKSTTTTQSPITTAVTSRNGKLEIKTTRRPIPTSKSIEYIINDRSKAEAAKGSRKGSSKLLLYTFFIIIAVILAGAAYKRFGDTAVTWYMIRFKHNTNGDEDSITTSFKGPQSNCKASSSSKAKISPDGSYSSSTWRSKIKKYRTTSNIMKTPLVNEDEDNDDDYTESNGNIALKNSIYTEL